MHTITACVGWVLFMMFAGVGFVSLPLGCFQTFAARPKATITRSEYISRAKDLAMQAKSIKVGACVIAAHTPTNTLLTSPRQTT